MVNEIVTVPNTILRKKSELIKKITPTVKKVAKEMITFMDSHSEDEKKPIGISACQLNHSLRVIAFRRNSGSMDREDIQVLINPELIYAKKQHNVTESCFSLPGKIYGLKRSKVVKIRGLTLDGTSHSFRGRDLLAQVFQHELNHLDGVLIDTIGVLIK